MPYIQKKTDGITFKVFVLPRSSNNMVSGAHGDTLKLKLTAPPVDGEANKMCLKFLAKLLRTPKSSLEIISGRTSRTKTILVRVHHSKDANNELERIADLIKSLFDK